jgi:hypothetical protein
MATITRPLIPVIVVSLLAAGAPTATAFDGVSPSTATVTAGGVTRSVQLLELDWSDHRYQLLPVLAHGRIKATESLAHMAQDAAAVAAVNGGFFNAYTNMEPQGTLEVYGSYLVNSGGTLMGVTANNRMLMEPDSSLSIKGGIDGAWSWPDDWYAWGFNRNYHQPSQIVVFTPAWGAATGDVGNGTCVVVDRGVVQTIVQGSAAIPAHGYVIYLGSAPDAQQYLQYLTPGSTVAYKVQVLSYGNPVDWSGVVSALGAGPLLVSGGRVVANPQAEGFTDPNITSRSMTRSFVGVTPDNRLVLGVIPNVTIQQAADILASLGLQEAMNLDDAASSGLWYQGQYLWQPSRNLSNALVVVYHRHPMPALTVNGKPLTGYPLPFITHGTTMVPLRLVSLALGASASWDPTTRAVTIQDGSSTISIAIGSTAALVSGQAETLPVAPVLKHDYTYVPLRFIAQAFGTQVGWNPSTYTVSITTP